MEKLTNMEAQRIINCMDDALDRINLLSPVPAGNPDPEFLEELDNGGAVQLKDALQFQWQKEEEFLVARAHASSHHGHGRRHHRDHENNHPPVVSGEIVSSLHQSVRTTCRQLRRDPSMIQHLDDNKHYEMKAYMESKFMLFHESLQHLTDVTFKKLATTVEEEATSKTLMHELVERERGAEDERNALSATLAVQREERSKEASALNELETKLTNELTIIKESNAAEKVTIATESAEARSASGANHEAQVVSLTEKKEKLTKELQEAVDKHKEAEVGLRKKKDKSERDLAAKITEYDETMTAKADEIKALKLVMAEEKAALDVLEEHFAKVDANNAQRAEEERILGEFIKRVEQATMKLDKAATIYQCIWRGVRCRAALKAATKGGKKGKKKK